MNIRAIHVLGIVSIVDLIWGSHGSVTVFLCSLYAVYIGLKYS